MKIYRLRDGERIIERSEGITSDVQVALRHLSAYLIRKTGTHHEDSILITDLPFGRLNINHRLQFHSKCITFAGLILATIIDGKSSISSDTTIVSTLMASIHPHGKAIGT